MVVESPPLRASTLPVYPLRASLPERLLLALALLAASPAPLLAQDVVRLSVLPFRGAGSAAVRNGLVRGLLARDDVELVPSSEALATATGLGVSLNDAAGREATAAELSMAGFVDGRVANRRVATVSVYGVDGEEHEQFRAQGSTPAGLARALETMAGAEIGAAILRLGWLADLHAEEEPLFEPIEEEDELADDAPRESEPEDESERLVRGSALWLEALELSLDVGLLSRSLRFEDDPNGELNDYRLGAAPTLGVGGAYFPMRRHVESAASGLGLAGSVDFAFVQSSRDAASGSSFETRVRRWEVELRYEAAFVRQHRLKLGLGYGRDSFAIDRETPVTPPDQELPPVPSVSYRFIRPALGGRFFLGRDVYVEAALGWRVTSSTGSIGGERWFPNSQAYGFDLSTYIAYRARPFFELRGGFHHARHVHDLRPEPADQWLAERAADRWTSLFLSLVALVPGDST